MAINSPTNLEFLKGHQNVYYAGLDNKAFPLANKKGYNRIDLCQHIRCLKILSLLVDHIAIPPTFLVSVLNCSDSSEIIKSYLSDFFQEKIILTAVYDSMSATKDFIDFKISDGSLDEKKMFFRHRRQAEDFFSHIPLLKREIPSASMGFRKRIIENTKNISSLVLPSDIKERLVKQIEVTAPQGEISLSREMFIEILDKFSLKRRAYLTCYYLMNAAYYTQGAETYFADISCLNVENFSVFGKEMFASNSGRIVVAYDPLLFQSVLLCHGVTINDIEALSIQDIKELRRTQEFLRFKELYFKMCTLIQEATLLASRLSRERLLRFKMELLQTIESRYHLERRHLIKWFYIEDFGSSLILGGLGFVLVGPIGAAIGATLGFIPPILRISGASPAELIIRKLNLGNFHFYLYLELLQEKLVDLVEETKS